MSGYDGALPLARLAIPINDDPVAGLPQFVRPGGIREQRRVMAIAALGVENREPCIASRIESPWSDPAQFSRLCRFPVFTIHVEEFLYGNLFDGRRVRQPDASETAGKGIDDPRNALLPETRDADKPAIVRCRFQVFEAVDAEITVQPRSLHAANTGDGSQNFDRIHFTAKTIEHGKFAGHD
jgi:hypothetical protein